MGRPIQLRDSKGTARSRPRLLRRRPRCLRHYLDRCSLCGSGAIEGGHGGKNVTAETPADGFWPAYRTAAAAITFDLDAESAILSSVPGSAGRLSLMTHQAYGPRAGVPR